MNNPYSNSYSTQPKIFQFCCCFFSLFSDYVSIIHLFALVRKSNHFFLFVSPTQYAINQLDSSQT